MSGRRDFLKVFGLSSAAFAATSTAEGTKFEVENESLKNLPPAQGHIRPFDPHSYNVTDAVLYSAAEIHPGMLIEQPYRLFHYSVGSNQVNGYAAYCDTNLVCDCSLPAPEAFAVQKIGLMFSPSTVKQDRDRFLDEFVFELWLGNRMYQRRPCAQMYSVGQLTPNEKLFTKPEIPDVYWLELQIPVVIETRQMFYVTLVGRGGFTPNNRMRMWALLGGQHARGIQ